MGCFHACQLINLPNSDTAAVLRSWAQNGNLIALLEPTDAYIPAGLLWFRSPSARFRFY